MGSGAEIPEQAAHEASENRAPSPAGLPSGHPAPPEPPSGPGLWPRMRCNVLVLSFLSFFAIGFGCWLVYARSRYFEEYAQTTESWRVGVPRMVELTVVKDDKEGLACASDQVIDGLHCGYRADLRPAAPSSPDSPEVLQPYNTIKNELLLGAGLWTAPELRQGLPASRFSVVCTYTPQTVMKSVSIRFGRANRFNPVGRTVTAGALTDCVLPR